MIIKLLSIVLITFLCVKCFVKSSENEFPIIIQEQVTQCGPVCLQMIAKHYGLNIELKRLEVLTKMDDSGTSILNLTEAADSIGLNSLAAKMTFDKLSTVPLPVIVHWNNNHFLIVYKISENTVWVADPKSGKKTYNRKDFCDNWLNSTLATSTEGIALLLELKELESN